MYMYCDVCVHMHLHVHTYIHTYIHTMYMYIEFARVYACHALSSNILQAEKNKYDVICKEAYDKAPHVVPYHRNWLDSPWKGTLHDHVHVCTRDVCILAGSW